MSLLKVSTAVPRLDQRRYRDLPKRLPKENKRLPMEAAVTVRYMSGEMWKRFGHELVFCEHIFVQRVRA